MFFYISILFYFVCNYLYCTAHRFYYYYCYYYYREASFELTNGARRTAKRIGVIIVDEADGSLAAARKQARAARKDGDIELFIIGVGKTIRRKDMYALATRPIKQHVFVVKNYRALGGWVAKKLQKAICPRRFFLCCYKLLAHEQAREHTQTAYLYELKPAVNDRYYYIYIYSILMDIPLIKEVIT